MALTQDEREELVKHGAERGAVVTWAEDGYMIVNTVKLGAGGKETSFNVPNLFQGKEFIRRCLDQIINAGGKH